MPEVDISLQAKNSSGEQRLVLFKDDGEYYFTLVGRYEGKPIQIDFDALSTANLEDMKAQIEMLLPA